VTNSLGFDLPFINNTSVPTEFSCRIKASSKNKGGDILLLTFSHMD
jgi:hypothetical protein